MVDPHLPPELERTIFIYAVRSRIKDASSLSLVAKRVHGWVLPVVFNVVAISQFRSFPIPFADISKFRRYGHHMQHLLIANIFHAGEAASQVRQELNDSLARCPNITNLVLWWREPPVEINSLTTLSKLTHLSIPAIYLVPLLSGLDPFCFRPDWVEPLELPAPNGPPLFPNITHLDTLVTEWFPHHCNGYLTTLAHHFPNLTHIAHTIYTWIDSNPTLSKLTLEKFAKLEVVVLWKNGLDRDGLHVDQLQEAEVGVGVDDDRVVCVKTSWLMHWERGLRGEGVGMWEFADGVLRERKQERVIR